MCVCSVLVLTSPFDHRFRSGVEQDIASKQRHQVDRETMEHARTHSTAFKYVRLVDVALVLLCLLFPILDSVDIDSLIQARLVRDGHISANNLIVWCKKACGLLMRHSYLLMAWETGSEMVIECRERV